MLRNLILITILFFSSASHAVLLTGSWNNTTFNSTGDVSFDINNASLPSISIIADFDGGVFGQPPGVNNEGPPPLNIPGTVAGSLATFTVIADSFYGDVTGTIDSNTGELDFLIASLPLTGPTETGLSIFSTVLEGSVTVDSMFNISAVDLNYLVIFNCGNPATRPVACPGPGEMGIEGSHYALGVIDAAAIPIPAALWMFISGLSLLGLVKRKQFKNK